MKVHESFSVACKASLAKRALFLETGMLKDNATGPMVTARRFALVNAAPEEWREKQAHEITGDLKVQVSKIEHTIIDPNTEDTDS
jgi:acyl-CoA reductase-like NAD-dependent aldehyde dehydrogenase